MGLDQVLVLTCDCCQTAVPAAVQSDFIIVTMTHPYDAGIDTYYFCTAKGCYNAVLASATSLIGSAITAHRSDTAQHNGVVQNHPS